MKFLSDTDIAAIAEAVRAAESRTGGEIVTVIAAHSDSYRWPVFFAASLVAFLVPGFVTPLFGIVSAGDLFFIQLAAFLILQIVLGVSVLRFALIPGAIKRAGARRLAREQFFERGLHRTQDRTGVLIFVSVAERYVEILADSGIDQHVDAAAWQNIIDTFTAQVRDNKIAEGFLGAVRAVGDILARHYPSTTKNPNELPDRLFVI